MENRMSFRASTGESGLRVLPDVFKDRLIKLAEETVDSLQVIWHEAGYEETECQSLLGDLLNKMKMTCASELAAEQQILEHAKQQVSQKLEEYTLCCAQLGRPAPAANVPSGSNYTDKLADLEKLLDGISGEVEQRQKLLDVEMEAIDHLVKELGDSPPAEDEFKGEEGTPHLSDVRLELMRIYKQNLMDAKKDRVQEVLEVAKQCVQNVTDLVLIDEGFDSIENAEEYKDVDGAIETFAGNEEGDFDYPLDMASFSRLQERCQYFVDEKEKRREELASTGAEIARLWTLLRIPSSEREEFQQSFKMNLSLETLARGRDELQRLKQVRAESLGRVIVSIRVDISALWDEAGVESDEQRTEEFAEYFTPIEELDDSAVEGHEHYYNTLLKRVEELRPLLAEIAKREQITKERIELEHIQMNPERLSARGPNAREERKREEGMHTRVKNLEKMTKRVMGMISKWEESNGPFLYAGEAYAERVASQDANYISIRDSLRNSRKKGKDEKNNSHNSRMPIKRASATAPGGLHSSRGASQGKNSSRELKEKENSHENTAPKSNGLEHLPAKVERDSTGSDGTECTSATELREVSRASTATVVKNR